MSETFLSAHMTVLLAVFAVAFVMGAIVNKTNFCTMGAVSDWVNMGDTGRFRAWILAMATAILGVTLLEANDILSVDKTLPPYRGSNFAWLEYVFGGFLFGIGMTLGSGCGNKTLIRIGGGNLKSIVVFAVIAVFAYFMINPFPGTDATIYSLVFYPWTHPVTVSMAGAQDLGSVVSRVIGGEVGMLRLVFGLLLAATLMFYVFRSKAFRGSFDNVLGGLTVGLAVLAAWYATGALVHIDADGDLLSWADYASAENWDMLEDNADVRPRDVGVQSFTFINPIGQTLRLILKHFDPSYVTFGIAAVLGVILGSWFTSMPMAIC